MLRADIDHHLWARKYKSVLCYINGLVKFSGSGHHYESQGFPSLSYKHVEMAGQ